MAKPSFINLWKAYEDMLVEFPDKRPCDGDWANQCAIRLSVALNKERSVMVNASTYSEPRCAHGHARGAESLANWLWKRPQLGPPRIYNASDRARLLDKTGIIFYKDFYYRPSDAEGRPTGDHIDLWNRGLTMTGDYFHRAKAVWFWELS
ncbi:type VI secretion system amidase effector protein Tae4 [Pseudomonas sp. SH1-B]